MKEEKIKFAELSVAELQEKFKHYKEELFNLRFQAVTGQLSNTSRISLVRRNIARVKTYLAKIENTRIQNELQNEYKALLKEENIDSMKTPLSEKISKLKARLSTKAQNLNNDIKVNCDKKVAELLKTLRSEVSKKLQAAKGKDDAQLKAVSRRLRDVKCSIRTKFLDKLSEMGLNDTASKIATIKESKREMLRKLEDIRTLQRELNTGKLPF